MKIIFPNHVYAQLEEYGNSLLPKCNYTYQQLKDHFTNKYKCKVNIKLIHFTKLSGTVKLPDGCNYIVELIK